MYLLRIIARAYRRLGVKIHPETGDIMDWLYQEGEDTLQHEVQEKNRAT